MYKDEGTEKFWQMPENLSRSTTLISVPASIFRNFRDYFRLLRHFLYISVWLSHLVALKNILLIVHSLELCNWCSYFINCYISVCKKVSREGFKTVFGFFKKNWILF